MGIEESRAEMQTVIPVVPFPRQPVALMILHVLLWDDDLSVTDFVGDSSPGRGAGAAADMT